MDASEEMRIYFRNLYRSKSPLDQESEAVMAKLNCSRCPQCGLWVGEENLEGDGCDCCDGLTEDAQLVLNGM